MVTTRRGTSSTPTTVEDKTAAPSDIAEIQSANGSNIRGEAAKQRITSKMGSDFFVRTLVGLTLAVIFVIVVRTGHMLVSFCIIVMEIGMYREIIKIGYTVAKDGKIPLWRTTSWYFFASALFFFYGKGVLSHFDDQGWSFMRMPLAQYMLKHHTFIAFSLYCAGFVGFVLSLKPGQYAFQFSYFGRALVALLLVVVQANFMMFNVKLGLIWFILPSVLVIINDSFAYIFGRLFGRHSLLSLSPKKTWEGFIGGGLATLVAAFVLSGVLASYPSLICPKYEFNDCYLICKATCQPSPNFVLQTARLNSFGLLSSAIEFEYYPVQLHSLALGFFASIIAPFGGFFASGAKRAFGKKDFGSLFPGHGGVTDRMDCQLLTAVFTYVYIINFVEIESPDVGKILSLIVELSNAEQLELFNTLRDRLVAKDIIPKVLEKVPQMVEEKGR